MFLFIVITNLFLLLFHCFCNNLCTASVHVHMLLILLNEQSINQSIHHTMTKFYSIWPGSTRADGICPDSATSSKLRTSMMTSCFCCRLRSTSSNEISTIPGEAAPPVTQQSVVVSETNGRYSNVIASIRRNRQTVNTAVTAQQCMAACSRALTLHMVASMVVQFIHSS